jgi:ferritin-like metal-binding protein YciE
MDKGKRRLLELLAEAHSNELALINTLEAHLRIAERGSYRSLLQNHLRETKSHADKVRKRMDRLGFSQSLFSRTYGIGQNLVKQGLVLTKGPIDLLRGFTDTNEKMLRNARDEATTEGFEIASYDAIEAVARGLGDHETAELAATIRLDEEQMLGSLRKEIPVLADLVVQNAVASEVLLDEPWPGYDDMNADEIVSRVSDTSDSLRLAVRNYEKKNKDRTTVIEAAERESATT